MTFTVKQNADNESVRDAEQLHEYLVDELGYSTYDVDIAVTNDASINITVSPGAAAPSDWSAEVLEEYCSRSKRDRRRLDSHHCLPDDIHDELQKAIDVK